MKITMLFWSLIFVERATLLLGLFVSNPTTPPQRPTRIRFRQCRYRHTYTDRLIEFHASNRHKCKPDDFVFFPDYKNRDTAMGVIGRLFKEIADESGLKESSDKHITLYSLRHTAIMFRLIMGKVDTLALARNARTSQAMIDKFYGAHLTTDQVREQLHAIPKGVLRRVPKQIDSYVNLPFIDSPAH